MWAQGKVWDLNWGIPLGWGGGGWLSQCGGAHLASPGRAERQASARSKND